MQNEHEKKSGGLTKFPVMTQDPPNFDQAIADLAQQYWQEEGCPENCAVQHWERAERELQSRNGASPSDGQVPGGIPNDTGASGKMG